MATGIWRGLLIGAALALPGGALAHPHEFVEASLTLHMANGQLTAIGVEWRYDPFTTMLILSDMGLNPAAETLEDSELSAIQGFDTNWIDGYEGDLYVFAGAERIALDGPVPGSTRLDAGQIVSTHTRPLVAPVAPPLVLRVYDPEYYIAYTLRSGTLSGQDTCSMAISAPDHSAIAERLTAIMDELYAGDADPEADFPLVGAEFAEELHLTCP
jgi:ABC-type uncharacterized transport system substrate-binding protein